MKTKLYISLVAAALCSSAVANDSIGSTETPVATSASRALTSAERSAIVKAVTEANEQMINAASQLDAKGMFKGILDSEGGVIIQDGRFMQTRQAALEATERGFESLQSAKYQMDQTFVTVLSSEAAVLTAEGSTDIVLADGRKFTVPSAWTLVFVLRDGQWKLLHGHQSSPNPQ